MTSKTEAGRRPVCTIRELATHATDTAVPVGGFSAAVRKSFYRKALSNLLSRLHAGKLHLAACPDSGGGPDSGDGGERLVTQNSALAWWDFHLLAPAPIALTQIIAPRPFTDPAGDYTLARLVTFMLPARMERLTETERGEKAKEARARVLNAAASGDLQCATITLSGSTLLGNKVTRHGAARWLLGNGFKLPPELCDLQ